MGKLLDWLKGMVEGQDQGNCERDRLPDALQKDVKQGVEVEEKELGQITPSRTPTNERGEGGGSTAAQGRDLGQEGQGR